MLALAALLSCFALSPDLCPTASAAHGHGTMLADSRPEPALAPISVTDCNLRRVSRPGKPDITVTYPMLGRKDVDRDVADWVERIASTFEAELAPLALEWQEQELPPCELIGSYTLTRPSANALSIVFEIWTYTGGAHGNLDVIPLTYSLLSGQRLGLVDIFENVDKALEIMSAVSRKELATRLGGGRVETIYQPYIDGEKELFEINALLTWFFRCCGAVCVRGTKDEMAAIEQTVEKCRNGETLLIFPEGTREKDGKLLPPKSGLFVIAAGAGVDVVPCRILYDTPDGKMHLFCKVRVIYGEPMPAEQFAMESRRDTKKLRANKQALLDAWEKMGA